MQNKFFLNQDIDQEMLIFLMRGEYCEFVF